MTKSIAKTLTERGTGLFVERRQQVVPFTGDEQADRLLSDLRAHPHAFVLACLMDRQIKAKQAWMIPYLLSQELGDFSMGTLAKMTRRKVVRLMSKPKSLHRFPRTMGWILHAGIQRVAVEYGGDASRIWRGRPSSAEVVYRFLEFDGAGPKIATMSTNILVREFKISLSDYYSIDISADVHVRRVFYRLGLCRKNATVEEVVYKARAMNPAFPGLLDFPCWEIGREWCKPRKPNCSHCYMSQHCSTAAGRSEKD